LIKKTKGDSIDRKKKLGDGIEKRKNYLVLLLNRIQQVNLEIL
jgi:hypothetical protein